MTLPRRLALVAIGAVLALAPAAAVTPLPSADGQFWDIQDTSPWAQDSGGIATGGRANPFNGFGYLKLQVRRADDALLGRNQYLQRLRPRITTAAGASTRSRRCCTEGIVVARAIYAPRRTPATCATSTAFTNSTDEDRTVAGRLGRRRRRRTKMAAGSRSRPRRAAIAGST